MKVVVIGSQGQLGSDIVSSLILDHEVVALSHGDIDVTIPKSCEILEIYNPDIVINTAAYVRVDECEENPKKAFAVNAIGAKNVCEVCEEVGALVVFISTDYVFDGKKDEPYTEKDTPHPVNTYGISKLAGEMYTRLAPQHYVFRVASLFGVRGASGKGGNFVETIVKKANAGESLAVVDDTVMSPTFTKDAASAIVEVLESQLPSGVYHTTNTGYCSWFEFARTIVELVGADASVLPIKSASLSQGARRPPFSALKSEALASHGLKMRHWKQALRAHLAMKGHIQQE